MTGFPVTAHPSAEFSEPMDPASSMTLVEVTTGASVAGVASYFAPIYRIEFTPSTALKAATVYRAQLVGARDLAGGNPVSPNASWTFTTAP
jgi:hypothetical protein